MKIGQKWTILVKAKTFLVHVSLILTKSGHNFHTKTTLTFSQLPVHVHLNLLNNLFGVSKQLKG